MCVNVFENNLLFLHIISDIYPGGKTQNKGQSLLLPSVSEPFLGKKTKGKTKDTTTT